MVRNAMARERLVALRQTIAGIEGRLAERLELPPGNSVPHPAASSHAVAANDIEACAGPVLLRHRGMAARSLLTTGAAGFDKALGGGLPFSALIEIHGRETRDAGSVAGFALALASRAMRGAGDRGSSRRPLLWIGTADSFAEAGFPYMPGLVASFDLAADELLFVNARRVADAAWIADEAARLDAFSAVLMELRGNPKAIGLTATRRLNRRAQMAGRPVFLLRQAGLAEATAAPVRLIAAPLPAGEYVTARGPLTGSIGPPGFSVTVSKNRAAPECSFNLTWNRNDRSFEERKDNGALVPVSGDRPAASSASGKVVAFG